jgi:hypothetical protein
MPVAAPAGHSEEEQRRIRPFAFSTHSERHSGLLGENNIVGAASPVHAASKSGPVNDPG